MRYDLSRADSIACDRAFAPISPKLRAPSEMQALARRRARAGWAALAAALAIVSSFFVVFI